MKKKIENALLELGIFPYLKGFDYICRAVEIIAASKEKPRIVKGVYGRIAKEFGTTSDRVERAIRHAFSKMDMDSDAFAKYINNDKFTNSMILYTLAYKLRGE